MAVGKFPSLIEAAGAELGEPVMGIMWPGQEALIKWEACLSMKFMLGNLNQFGRKKCLVLTCNV